MADIWYCTREAVKAALDSKLTARDEGQVDRAIAAASRDIEGDHHRRYYPEQATRRFDWPNEQYARSWRLWLDSNDLISVTTLVAGGVTIPASDYFLRRSDDLDEAPYTHIEIDLDSSSAFATAGTHQRQIVVTGLWGYRNDETTAGSLENAIGTTSTPTVDVTDGSKVGVGALLRCESERMIVTGRQSLDTGVNLGGDGLTTQKNDELLEANVGEVGEVLLVDAERMLVVDVAGSNRIVKRGWDGSTLAAHSAGADVYASRRLTVERGVLGTTAATHSDATALSVWQPPALIRDLCVAEAIAQVEQEQSGYGRVVGSGDNEREARGVGLNDLRTRAQRRYGRKARIGAV